MTVKKYPFKFLDAYTKEDHAIFFGREQELDELYRMVFQTNLLLVYGASGTGKTSLIRCGLANRFKETQWLDLYIRRGEDINQALLDTIRQHTPEQTTIPETEEAMDWFETLLESEKNNATDTEVLPLLDSDHPVVHALHDLYLATFTPIYLIFDQFEELYTLGSKTEQDRFAELLQMLVQLPLPLKIILAMREEYLGRLYTLEQAIPQLRHKKIRIEAMDVPRVEQVILSATVHNPHSNVHLAEGEEAAIAKTITEKIREGDIDVELPYLQVFMDRLYETASGEPTDRSQEVTFDLGLVRRIGAIKDVLADFIERQSRVVYQKLQQQFALTNSDIIWKLLSPFATLTGTKIPIKQSDLSVLLKSVTLPNTVDPADFVRAAVAELENSRILRYRKDENTYEVRHDTLARQIADKRSEEEKAYLKARRMVSESYATYQDTNTLLSREQLAFVRPYAERLRAEKDGQQLYHFIKDSRRKRQRQQIFLWSGIAAAFIIAIAVIIFVLGEQRKAQNAQQEAERALAAKEKKDLTVLLQDISQIAKGGNCPPFAMLTEIDSLWAKHQTDVELQPLHSSAMERMVENDCLE